MIEIIFLILLSILLFGFSFTRSCLWFIIITIFIVGGALFLWFTDIGNIIFWIFLISIVVLLINDLFKQSSNISNNNLGNNHGAEINDDEFLNTVRNWAKNRRR